MQATVSFDTATNKYVISVAGKILAKSKDRDYFEYKLARNELPKLAGVTKVVYTDVKGATVVTPPVATKPLAQVDMFTVNERFDLLNSFVEMAANGKATALIIAGEGGLGKSYAVTSTMDRIGKRSVRQAEADTLAMPKQVITEDDDDMELEEKVNMLAEEVPADYVVIKGYSTDSALYRTLYENNGRTIVFDDCDSILKSPDAINVLKGALDTNKERWISWNSSSNTMTIPVTFRFTGQVIFVTNLPLHKIDGAVRSRCYNIDVSMTTEQAIERMAHVLPDIEPHIDMSYKTDAFELLKANLAMVSRVSYRTLIKIINVRAAAPVTSDWKKMCLFTLAGG